MVKRHALPNGVIGYEMGRGEPPRMTWCYRVGSTLIDAGAGSVLENFLPVLLADGPVRHLYCAHRPVFAGGAAALAEKHSWMVTARHRLEAERAAGTAYADLAEKVFGPSNRAFERVSCGNVSRRNMLALMLGELKPRRDVGRVVGSAWARCDFGAESSFSVS